MLRDSRSQKVKVELWIFLGLFSLSALKSQSLAQDLPSKLSLDQAVVIALGRNRGLGAEENTIDVQKANVLSASKRLNPELTVTSEGYELFGFEPGRFFNSQELILRLDQELEIGGKRKLRTEMARLDLQSQQGTFRNAQRLLAVEVRRSYFLVVRAERNFELAKSLLADFDAILQINRTRHREGEISGGEFRRTEVELFKFQQDVWDAELSLKNARAQLLTLLGFVALDRPFEVTDPLVVEWGQISREGLPPRLSEDELVNLAFHRRPDLQAAALQVERSGAGTRYQRALAIPNLTVGGGYKRDFGDHTVAFGISVPLNIFNRNQSGIARAQAEQRQAQNQQAYRRSIVALEVHQVLNAVLVSEQKIKMLEGQFLGKAAESLAIARRAYELGATSLTDFLDVQRSHREIQRIYTDLLFEFRSNLSQLSAAIGK